MYYTVHARPEKVFKDVKTVTPDVPDGKVLSSASNAHAYKILAEPCLHVL